MARSSSSSSSGSPAAKRTAIAPKTQRAPSSSASASSSSKLNAAALSSLADALPDQTANLPTNNEPSLGDRINQSTANGKRLLNNNLQRKQLPRPLVNGSASLLGQDDDEHDDGDRAAAASSSKRLNGNLNGNSNTTAAATSSQHGLSDPSLHTLQQQDGAQEDDISPFPLPSSNPLSSSPALSHALTQALHSADTALLSSILSHSDPLLIRSTVQRLSGARALSLLEHCVSRLVANPTADGRARGTATGKVRTNVEWIRAILVIHTSYLMALPHLTTRLASLHMALSSRLASHQRLVALQGRLDLVLSQIEMRSAYAAAAGVSTGADEKAGKRRKGSAIQGVSSKLASANAATAVIAGQKKGNKRQLGEDDPTRWVEPSDDEDEDGSNENVQPTPNNTMDVDADQNSDDDEEESDEDDEEDDDEEEQFEELSPVDPASELEDDSDIEDIMLGTGFSSSSSSRANGTAKSRRRMLQDSDDGGDTTADSGLDDDEADDDDDDVQYGGLASAMRARGMAQRLAEAAKKTSASHPSAASASGLVKGPGSEDLVATKSRRGKRGAAAVAEKETAHNGTKATSAKASKMDLDEDDDEDDEDDESLLDEEGDSDLEDEDEEDDDEHADYGMMDMEAESTDGEGDDDEDEDEDED